MRTFLKWPGGKSWLAPRLAPELGAHLGADGTYFEPFVGSGAMFFALEPSKARLSDINQSLVATLATVSEHPGRVVDRVWSFTNTRDCYLKVRASRPRSR